MAGEVIRCASCGQANRVPLLGAGKQAVCGKCKAPLSTSDGHPITFGQFLRYGSVVVLMSLAISTVYLWLRYL